MPSCLGTWREVQENVTEWQCVLCEGGKLHASWRETLVDLSSEHTLDRNGPDSDLRAGEALCTLTSVGHVDAIKTANARPSVRTTYVPLEDLRHKERHLLGMS